MSEWYEAYLSEDGKKYIIPNYKIERFKNEVDELKENLAKTVEGLKFYAEEFETSRVYGFTVIRKAYSYDNFIKINERAREILKELGE